MNKQMKIALAVLIILLLSACGPKVGAVPATAPVVTRGPVEGKTAVPTVSVAGLAPEKYSRYVGMNYPPLPEGLSNDFALLIQDAEDYSLSLIFDGENKMLWLSKMTHRDAGGNAFWEVKDVLDLSNLEAGLILIPDGCFLNDVPDSEIIVTAKDETIRSAWRANTMLGRFEVLPTNGIECQSDKALEL